MRPLTFCEWRITTNYIVFYVFLSTVFYDSMCVYTRARIDFREKLKIHKQIYIK